MNTTPTDRSRTPFDHRVIGLVADLLMAGMALERRITSRGRDYGRGQPPPRFPTAIRPRSSNLF